MNFKKGAPTISEVNNFYDGLVVYQGADEIVLIQKFESKI